MTQRRRSQRQQKRTRRHGGGIFTTNENSTYLYKNSSIEAIRIMPKTGSQDGIDYDIKNFGTGSETLDITLKPNETVHGALGSLMYMNPNITPKRVKEGSFGVYNSTMTYTNKRDRTLELGFIPRLSGYTIEAFHIPKGRSLIIRGDAYIASTPGIKEADNWGLDDSINLRQAISPKTDSILWIGALGGIRPITIPAGETYIVNKKILVAHERYIESKKTTHKGLGRSGILGGEGRIVLLQNRSAIPQTVYIQTAISS